MTDRARLTDAEKKAFAIYELILTSSGDRPFSGHTLEQMVRDIADWKAQNPALKAIEKASAEVQLEFLKHSFEWLKAQSKERGIFRIVSTLIDVASLALSVLPKPLPAEIAETLLSDVRKDAWVRTYFPLQKFLAVLTRDQITAKMREDLQSLYLQHAPSATGKIEKHSEQLRKTIGELIRIDGEKELEPGRGPWSQIVFDEVAAKEDVTRAGWEALLEHCRTLEQTVPGKAWRTRTQELVAALGVEEVQENLQRWIALGPTPGQSPEARSPIEDSRYQKGVIWILGLKGNDNAAAPIANFGIACLRKIPMLGAVSQKVGFACVQVLGAMECSEAVSQLSRLRAKVKYSVARRLIEKSLRLAADRSGMTTDDLEDSCVGNFGLDAEAKVESQLGDAKAQIQLCADGRVALAWYNSDGKIVKSPPAHIRKAFAKEIKSFSALKKELESTYSAQCFRLESSFANPRTMSVEHWRKYFIEHRLLGFLGRRLIWIFRNAEGWEVSGLCSTASEDGRIQDSFGEDVDLSQAQSVSLWHPLSCDTTELQRWRDRIFALSIRQPFRQAFREFYTVTSDERTARMHSNRFAGILMRQHQLASLCRVRGWNYRLMGTGFDGFNVPSIALPQWNMHAEFYVDVPTDRNPELENSGLNEQSGSGINLFVSSDQVRFYRDRVEIPVDEVPVLTFSEIMRDVDLFTSVCGIGEDEKWIDQADRGIGMLPEQFESQELSGIIELRKSILGRVLPHTTIAEKCRLEKSWLNVRGQLGTYRIQLLWGGAMLTSPHPRWLNIPQPLLDAVPIDLSKLPLDLDYRTEMILRKAHVLADDWKIDSPDLICQLMPE